MGEAIFGLIGVVLGGVLAAGANFLFERRREHRRFDVARRLVGIELRQIVGQCWVMVADPRSPSPQTDLEDWQAWFLPQDAWEQHRETLAALPYNDWVVVANAYSKAMLLRLMLLWDLEPETPFSREQTKLVNDVGELAAEAFARIDPNPDGWRTDSEARERAGTGAHETETDASEADPSPPSARVRGPAMVFVQEQLASQPTHAFRWTPRSATTSFRRPR